MFRPLALAVLALSLLVAGCGGGSDSSSTETQTVTVAGTQALSKDELIQQGDAICKSAREKIDGLNAEIQEISKTASNSGDDLNQLADLYREGAATTQGEADQIRQLKPPAADQEIISQMLSAVDAGVGQLNEAADAVEADNTDQMSVVGSQLKTTAAKTKGIAQGYGFKVCGS